MSSGFGRDEMNALLGGGGLSEAVLRNGAPMEKNVKKKGSREKDVAAMSVQETAAMLKAEQRDKASKVGRTEKEIKQQMRHRASSKKSRNYHLLVDEDERRIKPAAKSMDESDSESDSNIDAFNRKNKAERVKVAPVIVKKKEVQQRNRRYDSSGSESDSDTGNSSQSSSDSETDRIRQRRLAKHKQHVRETKKAQAEAAPPVVELETSRMEAKQADEGPHTFNPKGAVRDSSSTSAASGDTSSEEDKSSEEDSSSDEEDETSIKRPVFIPKHRRGTVQSSTAIEEEAEKKAVYRSSRKERRQQESRIKVQQVLSQADSNPSTIDGLLGAPDDSDSHLDRDAWEVRELARVLHEVDKETQRDADQAELDRRRKLTDDQRLAEDIASGRYQKPGEKRETISGRYQHKGAFFMDKSEWDEMDVRCKASEYAKASTREGKARDDLPEVMKVKKFGFANQSKYRGLRAEDTSDRKQDILPLVNRKRKA